jgi:hypothetical protein
LTWQRSILLIMGLKGVGWIHCNWKQGREGYHQWVGCGKEGKESSIKRDINSLMHEPRPRISPDYANARTTKV